MPADHTPHRNDDHGELPTDLAPLDRELGDELAAFGRTLAASVNGPITSDRLDFAASEPPRRTWWLLGAAAAVAALVGGLAVVADGDGPATAPAASDVLPSVTPTVPTTGPSLQTTTVMPPTTAIFVEDLRPVAEIAGSDPLELGSLGWRVEPRRDEPWALDGDLPGCPAFEVLAGYIGVETSVVTYYDTGTGLDIDATFMAAPTDVDAALIRDAFGTIDQCDLPGTVTRIDGPPSTEVGVPVHRGFLVDMFSISATTANGNLVIALEIENADVDVATVTSMIERAERIVAASPWALNDGPVVEPDLVPMTTVAGDPTTAVEPVAEPGAEPGVVPMTTVADQSSVPTTTVAATDTTTTVPAEG